MTLIISKSGIKLSATLAKDKSQFLLTADNTPFLKMPYMPSPDKYEMCK